MLKFKTSNHSLFSFLFSLFSILYCAQISAQRESGGNHHFSPEEFRQQSEAFITREAGLTAKEAQKFFPLYHAMKDAQRKLMNERRQIECRAECGEISDKESLKALKIINAIEEEMLEIEQKYQEKILKVISASKYLRVKAAERKFERKMLRRMTGPQHHKK